MRGSNGWRRSTPAWMTAISGSRARPGRFVLRTEDGDITVTDCEAPDIEAQVDDGDIEFERCSGNFRVTAEDGDIRMWDVDSADVAIRTDDGNAELELISGGNLNVDVRTQDGDIDLDLGPAVSARFSIETDDGGIRIDAAAATDISKSNYSTSGTLGDGAGTIRVVSQDGRVTLRQAGS